MVVKEVRGRRRYVAFTVNAELTKTSLISLLRTVCTEPPYVVQCAEGWAIVRCSPVMIERTIELVMLADPSASSLKTSGTLKKLRDTYSELKRLRPKKTM